MYFKISELHSWGERAGQGRRHNYGALPFWDPVPILAQPSRPFQLDLSIFKMDLSEFIINPLPGTAKHGTLEKRREPYDLS